MKYKTQCGIALISIFILLTPNVSYNEQNAGSLRIDIKSGAGEKVDYHGMKLKIYQDFNEAPFKIIDSVDSNPYDISLPLGYRYKVELFVNSMFSGIGYADFQNDNQRLELNVPVPGSVRFTLVYNDGTPLEGASVAVKSFDGTYEYWTTSTTDENGNTVRYWLQPTILDDNYYVANIALQGGLSYTYSPININPGISRDLKIITPWPKTIDQLIVISVYESYNKKISQSDGEFLVELYDNANQKIATSKVNSRGEAYFSNLRVGQYEFHVLKLNDDTNKEWANTKITITGKQGLIQIFKNENDTDSKENNTEILTSDTEKLSITPENVDEQKILGENTTGQLIPPWIKTMVEWWVDGKITDLEFLRLIDYLTQNIIINMQFVEGT